MCILVVAVILMAVGSAWADEPERILRAWIEDLNSGDAARIQRWHVDYDRPGGPGAEARAHRDGELRQQTGGGFDVIRVVTATPTEVELLANERGGQGGASISLKLDGGKVAGLGLRPTDSNTATPPPRVDAAELVADLDAHVSKRTHDDEFSGVVLIARHGKPVFAKAYGFADREKHVPNRIDTKFRIGSMNKMFTSVAIAQLVAAGKLRYDDTLAKVLPEYPDKDIAAKVTVHNLLTHTAGLGDFFGPDFDKKKDSVRELHDYLQFFTGKPLRFEPSMAWSYSNAGMIVAGLVVEHVSGQRYFDYVQDHIFGPAGMKDSGFSDKNHPLPNQAKGYLRETKAWTSNFDTLPVMGSSAGGGDSTAPDLAAFAEALTGGRLVDPKLVETLTTGKVGTGRGRYAYGFSDDTIDGLRIVGHGGGAPGMNANLDIYWDTGVVVVVTSNLDPPAAQRVNDWIRARLKP